MRAKREAARTVTIPPCENLERRTFLETDIFEWLRWYFADIFTYEFTAQQREMIQAILAAVEIGDDQSIAGSRGEGKTTNAECALIFCVLKGIVEFAVLFAATGTDAENCLETIKGRLAGNDRLCADYPDVCVPIRALENTPNRAHYQIVQGVNEADGNAYGPVSSAFSWCGRAITMPDVPGSRCRGSIIATRGLDSAVRGLKIGDRRPDLAVIDDPDTIDTANSEEQAKKLEDKIDKAIAGLGGQQRRIARVMLTTLQNRICVSYRFTDPTAKPSWRGKRFRFLVKPPQRPDLWDEYIQLQLADWQAGTTHAHEHYVANRDAMDQGSEVANPNRYVAGELSAIQHYYNWVAKIGPEAVATEFDNDPPEETGIVESGITPHRIQRQVSGYERKRIPPGCTVLTMGVDVRKIALHWVVRAWRPDAVGYVIDYGVHEVHGTIYGSDEGVDVAIKKSILSLIEDRKADQYLCEGEFRQIDLSLIDAGWRTDAVYAACGEAGLGVMPVMGFGKSTGCVQANFSDIQRRSLDRKPGDGWFLSRKGRLWLVCADTDRWKAWEHDRWMTQPGRPGCLQMFGAYGNGDRLSSDEKAHHAYARHICNEVEIEEPYKDTIRRRWKPKSENTHWLDASYYCDVAANIKGVRLAIAATTPTTAVAATKASAGAPQVQQPNSWFNHQKKR